MEQPVTTTSPQSSDEPIKGYVPNKGMPRFVGEVENKRLRKVIEEKDALIEKFKKYDEERKAYCAKLQSEYKDMKDFVDSFTEELKELQYEENICHEDYEEIIKLYGQWYGYKNRSQLYKGKLKAARASIKDLKDDVNKLEELMTGIGNIRTTMKISDRFMLMRQHLEVLMSKLVV